MGFEKARCDECPLKAHWEKEGCWQPVDFEINTEGDSVVLVGNAPSKSDMSLGRPFCDANGALVLAEVQKLKGKGARRQVSWGNLIGCRWPFDDPKTYLAKLRRINRKRVAKGKEPLLSPIEACSGHREDRLEPFDTIVTMGSYAAKAITGGNPALEDVRGGPSVRGKQKLLATYSAETVAKQPKLRPILANDLAKAFRHHNDTLEWVDPEVHYNPSVQFTREFFASVKEAEALVTYDVETDGVDCLNADLRCIGIGTADMVLNIAFVSIDGFTRFYSPEDENDIKDILRNVFEDEEIVIAGHNSGYFDRMVIEQHLGVTPTPSLDTLLLHKLGASEYRHSLGFVGSVFTDVPSWKADHTGVQARTDEELHAYCATDVAVTARVIAPLKDLARRRDQLRLYNFDSRVQGLCAGMRRLGIRVDEGRRYEHQGQQTNLAAKWLRVLHEYKSDLNPNSNAQIRDILFGKWNLPVYDYTATGDVSVSATALRALVVNPIVDDNQRRFINALRFYRRAQKLLSTYLLKLAPDAGLVKDGYVYPDYNSHGTVTGRLSSSNPNFQNIPFNLRNIFIPPPGCVFVGADYDQLELRFASALAGANHYLDAFELKEIDPHNLTGELMFGASFWESEGGPPTKMGKGKGQFKQLRNLAKTICFASLYGASPPKVHEIISRAEDGDGKLLYADMNLRQIRALHTRWLKAAPEFKKWWGKTLETCRRQGYIEEVVLGRRRYFAKEDYNAILNFGVQAGGFAVVAQAMLDLVDNHLPFDFGQKTGLVNQLHDAVVFAVPESKADDVKDIVTEVLTTKVDGLPVSFTAEAEIGTNWRKV